MVFLAGKSPKLWSYSVHIGIRSWPTPITLQIITLDILFKCASFFTLPKEPAPAKHTFTKIAQAHKRTYIHAHTCAHTRSHTHTRTHTHNMHQNPCTHAHTQILNQFQSTDADITSKQKYAAWRASEIRKASDSCKMQYSSPRRCVRCIGGPLRDPQSPHMRVLSASTVCCIAWVLHKPCMQCAVSLSHSLPPEQTTHPALCVSICPASCCTHTLSIHRVVQNRIYTLYMTVCMGISLPKMPYTVCLRSLRKLINYLARKRKFLFILGGLSELTSKW